MTYTVHPAAALFPMMTDTELNELATDIKEHGLHQPLVLIYDESTLVDGRNRLRACEIAGVDFTTESLPQDYTEQQIIDYIVSTNIHRRHLTTSQRNMLGAELEPMYAEAAKRRQREAGQQFGENHPKQEVPADLPEPLGRGNEAREQAAKAVGGSGRGVSDAKTLKRDAPDLAEKVSTGEMSLDAATKKRKARKESEASGNGAAPPRPPAPQFDRTDIEDKINEFEDRGEKYSARDVCNSLGLPAGSVHVVERKQRVVRAVRAAVAEATPLDWDTIPGNQREKLERAKTAIRKELEREFQPRLRAEINVRVETVMNQARRMEADARRVLNGRKGILTKTDYDLIRSCLHPDGRLSVTDEKLAKAFRIFNEAEILLLNEKDFPTSSLPSMETLKMRRATG